MYGWGGERWKLVIATSNITDYYSMKLIGQFNFQENGEKAKRGWGGIDNSLHFRSSQPVSHLLTSQGRFRRSTVIQTLIQLNRNSVLRQKRQMTRPQLVLTPPRRTCLVGGDSNNRHLGGSSQKIHHLVVVEGCRGHFTHFNQTIVTSQSRLKNNKPVNKTSASYYVVTRFPVCKNLVIAIQYLLGS